MQCSPVFFFQFEAPTHPPAGLVASWINSSAFFLSWNAPPFEHQNGIIRSYEIHITEQNTSMEFLLSSSTTERVVDSLHPNYDYVCIVATTTIRLGPFSTSILVRTSEDGTFVYIVWKCIHSSKGNAIPKLQPLTSQYVMHRWY